ncbi:ribosomal protein [Favolaschia claudopus]|uniref:Ribosomal protein n=1 Tax=Favolaschia claudopus TaxID=2862362 RepID=A0AAW0EA53_9AGAR
MALRCSLRRSLSRPAVCAPPSLTRPMSSLTDQNTASDLLGPDILQRQSTDKDPEPWMLLPTLSSLGGGQKHQPLMNFPPAEDPLLQFLTSQIMRHGERAKARRVVSKTLTYIFTLTRAPPLPILREAVLLASPAVKAKSQTRGAKVVHIPMALSEKQRTHYGIMWLLASSKNRVGRRLEERLAREMVDIVQRSHAARDLPRDTKHPGALGLKADMHRFATVNRGSVRVEPGAARAMAAAAAASITAPRPEDAEQSDSSETAADADMDEDDSDLEDLEPLDLKQTREAGSPARTPS